MKEEISVHFRMVFRDGAAGERGILEEKRSLFSCASDWRYLVRFRAGVGPVPASRPARMVPSWLPDSSIHVLQKASTVGLRFLGQAMP
jgi:hypothetical protein